MAVTSIWPIKNNKKLTTIKKVIDYARNPEKTVEVESYWLVHKNLFETTTVNGKMRIFVDSFEQWYNGQLRYRKVNGPEPAMLEGNSMTLKELAEELGISESTAYKVVCTDNQIKHTLKDGSVRFSREDFDEWYLRFLLNNILIASSKHIMHRFCW